MKSKAKGKGAEQPKENNMIKLGLNRKDNRSIEEIQKSLRKDGKGKGKEGAEGEEEEFLRKRKEAMERKRLGLMKKNEEEDLFGSGSESEDQEALEKNRKEKEKMKSKSSYASSSSNPLPSFTKKAKSNPSPLALIPVRKDGLTGEFEKQVEVMELLTQESDMVARRRGSFVQVRLQCTLGVSRKNIFPSLYET